MTAWGPRIDRTPLAAEDSCRTGCDAPLLVHIPVCLQSLADLTTETVNAYITLLQIMGNIMDLGRRKGEHLCQEVCRGELALTGECRQLFG